MFPGQHQHQNRCSILSLQILDHWQLTCYHANTSQVCILYYVLRREELVCQTEVYKHHTGESVSRPFCSITLFSQETVFMNSATGLMEAVT